MASGVETNNSLPPVRIRTRTRSVVQSNGAITQEQRIIADSGDDAPRKKRKPNSGSMKKGETRNPHGRPKGAKGAKATVRKVLGKKTEIRFEGKKEKVNMFESLLWKELQLAHAGDWRARRTMLEFGRWAMPELVPGADSRPPEEQRATDEAILAWFTNEVREQALQAKAKRVTKKARGTASAPGTAPRASGDEQEAA